MSSSFKELVEPKDVDYALRRRTDRIYISSSFEAKVGSDKGSPSRFIRKVFDEVEEEDGRDNLESEDYEVSTTPGGRKQIQLQVVREAGVIRQIEIQKVSRGSKGNDKPELKSILSLNREQSTKLIQLIKALDSIPPDGDRIERIDDYLVREMLSLPDTLRQAYAEDPERFKELIRTDASASDVIALQHRRKVVETMQTWLTDAAAFEEASNASKGPERAWQQLLEKNPWVLGVGLGWQLLSSWDQQKLEQVTTGADITTPGKRVDALLRTNGIVRSMVFAEIKHHRTALLGSKAYRSGSWAPSPELSGAVAQVQQTVRKAVQELGEYVEDRAPDGSRSNDGTFITQPKAYLVVGSLAELTGESGGPIDDKVHSFELFRQNVTHPEIITFDELLARAEWHVKLVEDQAEEERNTQ